MAKKSFKEKLLFSGRKLAISIKRNYYVVPMMFVFITCLQFMCVLHILSPNFNRISYGEFNCMFIFIISLLLILASVAYLNYALKKYGQKRPIYMLIIYFLMAGITLFLLFKVFEANNFNVLDELAKLQEAEASKNEAARIEALKFYQLGLQSRTHLLVQIILNIFSVVMVATAPLVQGALNKLKFKRIENNEQ